MSAALATLLLASATLAHEPHDPTFWVAVSPGSEAQWMVVTVQQAFRDATSLIRSQNLQDVEVRYLYPSQSGALCAAMLGATRLAVGTAGQGLWLSDDVGDSFTVHTDLPATALIQQLEASPQVLDDGLALAVGTLPDGKDITGAIWRSQDAGDSWQVVSELADVSMEDLSLAPDFASSGRAFALDEIGQLYRSEDFGGSWQLAGQLDSAIIQLATGSEGRVWLATAEEGLLLSEDGGQSFEPAGFEDSAVVVVEELASGVVLAALPEEAMWASFDTGLSWELSSAGLEEVQTSQPADGVHYYQLHEAGDGAVYLASWEGVAWSHDQGVTWANMESMQSQMWRGIGLAYDARGFLSVFGGNYGAGIERVTPELGLVQPLGSSTVGGYVKELTVPGDWGRDCTAFSYQQQDLQLTTDGDISWTLWADEQMGDFWQMSTTLDHSSYPWLLAAGNVDDGGGWCHAGGDFGDITCHTPTDYTQTCTSAHVPADFPERGQAWVGCGSEGQLWTTSDHGDSWSEVARLNTTIFAMAAGGDTLLLASPLGLFRSIDGAEPQLNAFENRPVWSVVASPQWDQQPVAFAQLADEGPFRSEDGGDSWQPTTRPSEELGVTLAISPQFAQDDAIALGSFDGGWLSRDQGQTWEAVHALETIDDRNAYWDFDSDWVELHADGQIYHQYRECAVPGSIATLTFQGIGLDLMAATRAEAGTMLARLDGQDLGEISLVGTRAWQQVVLELRDLEDGWHQLELEVVEGRVQADAARVWRLPGYDYDRESDEPDDTAAGADTGAGAGGDPWVPPAQEGRCEGCGQGARAAGAGALLAWLALLGVRRRRA